MIGQASARDITREYDEVSPVLEKAIGQLRDKDRQAVLLRFFKGMSHEEVGAAMGVSSDAAKMRVRRAVERMRAELGRHGSVLSVDGSRSGAGRSDCWTCAGRDCGGNNRRTWRKWSGSGDRDCQGNIATDVFGRRRSWRLPQSSRCPWAQRSG